MTNDNDVYEIEVNLIRGKRWRVTTKIWCSGDEEGFRDNAHLK
jgi:hypothetical protein